MAQLALCTIADRDYLPRLLVMANSLARFHPSLRLRVLCLDEATEDVLTRHGKLDTTSLTELERADPMLAQAHGNRSHREYAWTLKPVFCLHVLEQASEAAAVMFLDADLMFFGSATSLFDELADRSILLVAERHMAPPVWSPAGLRSEVGGAPQGARTGYYNSGMVGFRRDPTGLSALRWWRDCCLASCRDAPVTGRGNQWYLNAVPERFPGVTIIDHPGVGLAPWNARRVRLERRGQRLLADGEPVVFYHFQSLRLRRATPASRLAAWCSNDLGPLPGITPRAHAVLARHWRLPRQERQLLWQPCRRELAVAARELDMLDHSWFRRVLPPAWTELLADVFSELRWRAYLFLGRVLPEPLRVLASRLRASLIRFRVR